MGFVFRFGSDSIMSIQPLVSTLSTDTRIMHLTSWKRFRSKVNGLLGNL